MQELGGSAEGISEQVFVQSRSIIKQSSKQGPGIFGVNLQLRGRNADPRETKRRRPEPTGLGYGQEAGPRAEETREDIVFWLLEEEK